MDLGKVVTRLEAIEDHAERLKRIEETLDKLLESNQRQARYLEEMLKMYQQAMQGAQNQ